jgi:hypothetical protein
MEQPIVSKVKVKHPIEYQEIDGIKYLLLKRSWQRVKRGDLPKTEKCPFCGCLHIHGGVDGHRIAHCPNPPHITCIADDGSILNSGDGYIVVSINRPV